MDQQPEPGEPGVEDADDTGLRSWLSTGEHGQASAAGADIGDEDVLTGAHEPPPPRGQRTSFRRARDLIAVALIVVVSVAAGVLVWRTSDIKATNARLTATCVAAMLRLPSAAATCA